METFFAFILDSSILIIFLLFVIAIGFIFTLLGKIPPLRWIGRIIFNTVIYTLQLIFNILAVLIYSLVVAIGVIGSFLLFQYLDWNLFTVGDDILFITHDEFILTGFLIALFFVGGILFGTIAFSLIPLSMRKYTIFSYISGILSLLFLLPFATNKLIPHVEITHLGIFTLVGIIPVLGIMFIIGSAYNRKMERREMSFEERKWEDVENEERAIFKKRFIFPWIHKRRKLTS